MICHDMSIRSNQPVRKTMGNTGNWIRSIATEFDLTPNVRRRWQISILDQVCSPSFCGLPQSGGDTLGQLGLGPGQDHCVPRPVSPVQCRVLEPGTESYTVVIPNLFCRHFTEVLLVMCNDFTNVPLSDQRGRSYPQDRPDSWTVPDSFHLILDMDVGVFSSY